MICINCKKAAALKKSLFCSKKCSARWRSAFGNRDEFKLIGAPRLKELKEKYLGV